MGVEVQRQNMIELSGNPVTRDGLISSVASVRQPAASCAANITDVLLQGRS